MKLILKPNYKKFSFQQLVDFFNKYIGEEQNAYLKVIIGNELENKCILYKKDDDSSSGEVTESLLRNYFEDEIAKENVSCFDFFNEK